MGPMHTHRTPHHGPVFWLRTPVDRLPTGIGRQWLADRREDVPYSGASASDSHRLPNARDDAGDDTDDRGGVNRSWFNCRMLRENFASSEPFRLYSHHGHAIAESPPRAFDG
jgi:hypothetical protein